MKKILMLSMAILVAYFTMAKQTNTNDYSNLLTEKPKYEKFGIGFGIGFGVFYPGDVNDWLKREYSNYTVSGGNVDLFMSEQLSFVASFRPIEMIRFNIVAEACIGPKLIITNDKGTQFHNFGRYSFGIEAYLNIPIGSGRHSILFGGGALYHHLHFEDARAGTVGLRVVPFGMSFDFGKLQTQILIGGDLLTTANDGNFELSYNQGFVHINLLF